MNWFFYLLAVLVYLLVVGLWLRNMKPARRKAIHARLVKVWDWARSNGQELVGIPAALVLFWLSGQVLRWLEPTSALYDAGVLQGATVVVVHLLIGNSLARFGTKLNIEWYSDGFKQAQDRKWLFATYLAAYCLLAAVL